MPTLRFRAAALLAPAGVLAALLAAAPRVRAQAPAGAGDAAAGLTDNLMGTQVVAVGLGAARAGAVGGAASTVLLGSARFAAWFRPTWALEVTAARYGAFDSDAVTPVLLGVAWYPRVPDPAARVRPYASAGVGLFVRQVTDEDGALIGASRHPAQTDAAPGARVGVGVDVLAGRRLVLGAALGYHAAGALPALPARLGGGGATRASGPVFAVTAGLRLPRRGD